MSAEAGAAAAAAEAKRREEEEEEMTAPDASDAGPYEYKILRSATGAFRKPEVFRQALEEEATTGWELLEKFDNNRIRLRRHVKWRERDAEAPHDPYRIRYGTSEAMVAVWILLGVFLGIPVVLGAIFGAIFLIIKMTQ